ncbi:uncharacterized protein LOC124930320 [Impatiens glandulifera]|uniref:uncharacterized protein LOC124930320 n=1 Tax=Impatiens glandulifera TaxID=253017 RepID=UPI001FB19B25|nr:uncharacterized protein LOC124930320 [Impatiens glandulifera]
MKRFNELILELILMVIEQAFVTSPSFYTMSLWDFHAMLRREHESARKYKASSSNGPNEAPNNSGLFNFSHLERHVAFSQANHQQSSKDQATTSKSKGKGKLIEDPLVTEQTNVINERSKTTPIANPSETASDKSKVDLKRKSRETDEAEGIGGIRRSRDWMTEKLRVLKELMNSCKVDTTSFDEEAFDEEDFDEEDFNEEDFDEEACEEEAYDEEDFKYLEILKTIRENVYMDQMVLNMDHMHTFSPIRMGYGMGMMNMTPEFHTPYVNGTPLVLPIHFHGPFNQPLMYIPPYAGPSSSGAHFPPYAGPSSSGAHFPPLAGPSSSGAPSTIPNNGSTALSKDTPKKWDQLH